MQCDPTSFSNSNQVKVQQLDINWTINFEKKSLQGHVDLKLKILKDAVTEVILDTRDILVHKVTQGATDLKYVLKEKHKVFGSPLCITLDITPANGDEVTIRVEYETSSQASALQWLNPEQTAGKQHPYMFSQCQAIHARSIIPCQDTPSIKCPYNATVKVKDPLVVLMSAIPSYDRRAKDSNGNFFMTYNFEQTVPMPSYLIAIAAGFLKSKKIGPRSKVWSEPEMVEASANEFAETEKMLVAAESIVGPYVWKQYDLLVLPPTFPYGGMENPCLTFVTPTLLAGDRSLANVIAHEAAHSWTGNLVTNHTWEDFWLNEGHTVFLERKIVEKLNGPEMRHFQALNGLRSLKDSIDLFGEDHPYTNLVVKLDGVDPDDCFSSVPYEKGHTLLFYLETLLGDEHAMDPFLKSYIDKFKYKTVTTQQWKDHLYQCFTEKKSILDKVDWDAWFNKPGMPPVIPEYDQTLAKECTQLANRWAQAQKDDLNSFKSSDIKTFSAWQKIGLLGQLLQKDPLSLAHIKKMEDCYKFSSVQNSEIKFRWIRLCIRTKSTDAIQPGLNMATDQGRMKFTRPLFRDLGNWEVSRPKAIDHFHEQKKFMHSTTAQLVEKDLKL